MANYGSTIWPAALLDMSKEYGRFPDKKRAAGFSTALCERRRGVQRNNVILRTILSSDVFTSYRYTPLPTDRPSELVPFHVIPWYPADLVSFSNSRMSCPVGV